MKCKGSVTVEMAFLVPIVFSVIVIVMQILFYFHDKIILEGVVHETVTVCSSREEITEEEVERYFQEALGKRLLMFGYVETQVELAKDEIQMSCCSRRNRMQVEVSARMKCTDPETTIRRLRMIKRLGNMVGESM